MKVCVLGDTHFGARNDSAHFSKFFEKFYTEIFFPYMEKHNILHVIQLGDVFDRRKYVNFQTLQDSKRYFFDRLNRDYTSWLLIGNHDAYYKNTNDVNSLEMLLGEYYNIKRISSPTEVDLEGTNALLLPWICMDNEQEVMKVIKETTAQIAFGHLELTGFEMHKGQVMDHGMDSKIFNKFELVVSGHYHHRSSARNVTYAGTPYEMTWSDYADIKGFHVFDTETRELNFISNPFTIFHKLHYDDAGKDHTYLSTFNIDDLEGCYVKLIVRNKTNHFWFDTLVDQLEKIGVVDLQVVEDHFHMDMETDEDIINEAEDTITILNKFVEQVDMNIDKKKLNTLLHSLYEEAINLE